MNEYLKQVNSLPFYLIVKKKMEWLENFSVAVSMIVGMAAAVLISL